MDVRLQIVELCKERIAAAKDKDELRLYLYDIIAALNGGERNPLKISNKAVAENILYVIRQYGTEEQARKAAEINNVWQSL